MKIIKFIFGTVISIIAVAIATKIAAFILGVASLVVFLLLILLKLMLIVGVAALIIWGVSRLFSDKRRTAGF